MHTMSTLKRWTAILMTAALAFGTAGQALAETIFDFSFTGVNASGSGSLTANDNGDGSFTAVGGTGTFNINSIVGTLTLLPNPNAPLPSESPSTAFFFDNQLFLSEPFLTGSGLLFLTDGNAEVNIYGNGEGYTLDFLGADLSTFTTSVSFSLEVRDIEEPPNGVPEPGTVALLGLGLLGFAHARRRLGR